MQVDKRTMFDNLELILLTIDEVVSVFIAHGKLACRAGLYSIFFVMLLIAMGGAVASFVHLSHHPNILTPHFFSNYYALQLDHGHIMETDALAVVTRVLMKSSDNANNVSDSRI